MAQDDDRWSDDETCAIDFAAGGELTGGGETRAYVTVLSGSRLGEMIEVTDELTVGRGDDAELQVRDDGVSRLHARLVHHTDGSVEVVDLGSRNGTHVNGKRVDRATLADGDKILIGSLTILKFSFADRAEESFQQQMYNSALRDPLTGLYNRRFLENQLEAEFSYAVRHQTSLSVVLLDLDHFKSINDTYGHPAGDHVLVSLAGLLKGAIRTEDLAARFGGEEFVIVCRGIPATIARNVTERIRRTVERSSLVPEQADRVITISAGVASVPHPRIADSSGLIDAADQALYRAKNEGRNRVVLF